MANDMPTNQTGTKPADADVSTNNPPQPPNNNNSINGTRGADKRKKNRAQSDDHHGNAGGVLSRLLGCCGTFNAPKSSQAPTVPQDTKAPQAPTAPQAATAPQAGTAPGTPTPPPAHTAPNNQTDTQAPAVLEAPTAPQAPALPPAPTLSPSPTLPPAPALPPDPTIPQDTTAPQDPSVHQAPTSSQDPIAPQDPNAVDPPNAVAIEQNDSASQRTNSTGDASENETTARTTNGAGRMRPSRSSGTQWPQSAATVTDTEEELQSEDEPKFDSDGDGYDGDVSRDPHSHCASPLASSGVVTQGHSPPKTPAPVPTISTSDDDNETPKAHAGGTHHNAHGDYVRDDEMDGSATLDKEETAGRNEDLECPGPATHGEAQGLQGSSAWTSQEGINIPDVSGITNPTAAQLSLRLVDHDPIQTSATSSDAGHMPVTLVNAGAELDLVPVNAIDRLQARYAERERDGHRETRAVGRETREDQANISSQSNPFSHMMSRLSRDMSPDRISSGSFVPPLSIDPPVGFSPPTSDPNQSSAEPNDSSYVSSESSFGNDVLRSATHTNQQGEKGWIDGADGGWMGRGWSAEPDIELTLFCPPSPSDIVDGSIQEETTEGRQERNMSTTLSADMTGGEEEVGDFVIVQAQRQAPAAVARPSRIPKAIARPLSTHATTFSASTNSPAMSSALPSSFKDTTAPRRFVPRRLTAFMGSTRTNVPAHQVTDKATDTKAPLKGSTRAVPPPSTGIKARITSQLSQSMTPTPHTPRRNAPPRSPRSSIPVYNATPRPRSILSQSVGKPAPLTNMSSPSRLPVLAHSSTPVSPTKIRSPTKLFTPRNPASPTKLSQIPLRRSSLAWQVTLSTMGTSPLWKMGPLGQSTLSRAAVEEAASTDADITTRGKWTKEDEAEYAAIKAYLAEREAWLLAHPEVLEAGEDVQAVTAGWTEADHAEYVELMGYLAEREVWLLARGENWRRR